MKSPKLTTPSAIRLPVVGISSLPVPVLILAEDWDSAPNEEWLLVLATG